MAEHMPHSHTHRQRENTAVLPTQPELIEVGDGVLAYVQESAGWHVNNAGAILDRDRTVLVDTCATERRTRALYDSLREAGAGEVDLIINTHEHGDHTNGNCLFPQARVIGHSNCRVGMAQTAIGGREETYGPIEWGDLRLRAPDLTFEDTMSVYLGEREVRLLHPGASAHTDGDLYVWVPQQRVLFAGDLVFNGGTPFVLMGTVTGWLSALEQMRSLSPATIVPGHGPLGGIEMLDPIQDYLTWIKRFASEAHSAGLTPLEAAQQPESQAFAHLGESERLVGNLWSIYAQIEGRRLTRPELHDALADMVRLKGRLLDTAV